MSYRCNDCSYKQRGRFPKGGCPACGSFNIQRLDQQPITDENASKGKTWRLLLSLALWIILAYLLYQKF